MTDFIIVSPAYAGNSNGVKTLHKICHTINEVGGTARMAFIKSSDPNCQDVTLHDESWTNPKWNTPVVKEDEEDLFDTSIVIYPEIITGNPFKAKKVARYFGNREGYCNGKMIKIEPTDFLFAHSIVIRRNAHAVLFNSEIHSAFHERDAMPREHRKLDVTYVGKGHLYGNVGLVKDTMAITREWPMDQEQLAMLLRTVRCFYTWDSWTSINVEAALCGAVPYFLRYDPWSPADLDDCEIGPIPRLDKKNKDFNAEKFEQMRKNMQDKLGFLAHTWEERVHALTQQAAAHFSNQNTLLRTGT